MPRPEVSSPTKAFWDSGPAGSRRVSWPMEPWQSRGSRGRNMEKSLFKLFVISNQHRDMWWDVHIYNYIYIYTVYQYIHIYIWNFGPGMLINHRTLGDPLAGDTSCFNWSDSIDVPTRLISGIVFPLFLCPQSVTNKQTIKSLCFWSPTMFVFDATNMSRVCRMADQESRGPSSQPLGWKPGLPRSLLIKAAIWTWEDSGKLHVMTGFRKNYDTFRPSHMDQRLAAIVCWIVFWLLVRSWMLTPSWQELHGSELIPWP